MKTKKKKKTKLQLWLDAIAEAKGENKIMVILFGWIFVLTAHDSDDKD